MPIFGQLFDPPSSTYTYLHADRQRGEPVGIDPVCEHMRCDAALIAELGLSLVYSPEAHVQAEFGGIGQRHERQAAGARHRGDRLLVTLVMDKDRPDQIGRGQHMLGNPPARPGIAAIAPHPKTRIGGVQRQKFGHWAGPRARELRSEAKMRQSKIGCPIVADNVPRHTEGRRIAAADALPPVAGAWPAVAAAGWVRRAAAGSRPG